MDTHGPGKTDVDGALPLENDDLVLGTAQFGDANRVTPKHVRGDFGWIVAGAENHNPSAGDVLQQAFEVAICGYQDQIMRCCVLQDAAIPSLGSPFRSALSESGKRSCNKDTSRAERLSSKRSFIPY